MKLYIIAKETYRKPSLLYLYCTQWLALPTTIVYSRNLQKYIIPNKTHQASQLTGQLISFEVVSFHALSASPEGDFFRHELQCDNNFDPLLRAACIALRLSADDSTDHLIGTILVIAVITLLLNVAIRLMLNQVQLMRIVRPRTEPSPSTATPETTLWTIKIPKCFVYRLLID